MENHDIAVGIIGAGWLAQFAYLPAVRYLGYNLNTLIDLDLEAVRKRLGDLDGAILSSEVDSLANSRLDLIVVSSPTHMHLSHCECALATGSRVLCEKKLVRNSQEAERLRSHPFFSNLFGSSPFRYREDFRELKDVVDGGALGTVNKVSCNWVRRKGVPRPGSWYTSMEKSGGGALSDLGTHLIDLGLLLLRPTTGLTSCQSRLFYDDQLSEAAVSWMGSGSTEEGKGNFDVETGASVRYTFGEKVLELQVSWVGETKQDTTQFLVEGQHGRATLETLLGYSPNGPNGGWLTLDGCTGAKGSNLRPLNRVPEDDFSRLLQSVLGFSTESVVAQTGDAAANIVDLVEMAYLVGRGN